MLVDDAQPQIICYFYIADASLYDRVQFITKIIQRVVMQCTLAFIAYQLNLDSALMQIQDI